MKQTRIADSNTYSEQPLFQDQNIQVIDKEYCAKYYSHIKLKDIKSHLLV